MTPKEKAEELVDKYKPFVYPYVGSSFLTGDEYPEQILNYAKQCALIAVDEILNDYSYMQNVRNANSNQIHSRRVYWQEVKQEITNI
ncbi:hypothetical protein UFOVP533_33 [uncultured Caudovirales phage]|uniref:Uncharacterized protein n=1 Tax=uncultured Caudovirales phage TaxID=2100421 RepID=A0A6J5MR26_9CAUD|nr:hypothetical protein UFOVP533_33 [uncultured Caudovirales phage]